MTIVSSGALIDVLRQYRLLSQQQLSEVLALAQGRCTDVRALAKVLIQRGWFSVYQVNELLAGRAAQLVLGPYIILDRLGKGGQSEVYKAHHPENNWTVALKVIRSERLQAPAAAAQFLQEVEAMASLEHPNIVEFWDADKAGDAYYFAMEFVDGTDLGKVVQLAGCLPPAQASEYIRQAAMALQHAHEHSLVHRDIKPVNLFLTQPVVAPVSMHERSAPAPAPQAPVIKILDWGLASLPTGEDKEDPLLANNPHTANIIGTVDYLSPEQAINPRGVDIRGDIYSLGCTLYFLLTGRVPFNGTTVMQKILQHQKKDAPLVEVLSPAVPAALAAIVRRMMAKKPEDRFQTPAAVALALTPFGRGNAGSGQLLRPNGPPPSRPSQDTPRTARTMAHGTPTSPRP
jgi:serine/threonine protein kinase